MKGERGQRGKGEEGAGRTGEKGNGGEGDMGGGPRLHGDFGQICIMHLVAQYLQLLRSAWLAA